MSWGLGCSLQLGGRASACRVFRLQDSEAPGMWEFPKIRGYLILGSL